MDLINEEFKKYSNNTKIPAAIRAAIQVGRRTLNRYYSRTDDAEIYRIAMGKSCIQNSSRHDLNLIKNSFTPTL